MPDTVSTAIIAAAGVVVGATVTAIASAYSARQKVRELEVTYQQKLRVDYLSNARLYTSNLYVPLSITLTKLMNSYYSYRAKTGFKEVKTPEDTEEVFRQACNEFVSEVQLYFDRGASAFLTTELEERLSSFNSFITESLTVRELVTKMIIQYEFGSLGLPLFPPSSHQLSHEVRLPTKYARLLPRTGITASFGLLGFTYRGAKVLAAPIASRDFEERILRDLAVLKALVKEVTLGAHANV